MELRDLRGRETRTVYAASSVSDVSLQQRGTGLSDHCSGVSPDQQDAFFTMRERAPISSRLCGARQSAGMRLFSRFIHGRDGDLP